MGSRVEPHLGGVLDTKAPYFAKQSVTTEIVAVLHAHAVARRLELTLHPSRAVCAGEVHELFATDEEGKGLNATVDRVGYIACVAVKRPGMILVKDSVRLNGRVVGTVIGFDETHLPNHMNIVMYAPSLQTGRDIGAELGDEVSFEMGPYPVEIIP